MVLQTVAFVATVVCLLSVVLYSSLQSHDYING